MKKFLIRALPLCLALLIFVGSLAVPAFAAAVSFGDDLVPLSGIWDFGHTNFMMADFYDSFEFVYNGFTYSGIETLDCDYVSFAPSSFQFAGEGECVGGIVEVVGTAYVSAACYQFFADNAQRVDAAAVLDSSNDDSIFSVFTGISGWIVTAIGDLMPMFYTESTGLTFVGTLAVAALAFAVIFLIIAIIRRFMHFAG